SIRCGGNIYMMKKYQKPKMEGLSFKRFILFLLLFFGTIGAISYVDRSILSNYQQLQNPGFEQSSQFWEASGGTLVVSTGNPMFGYATATWDSDDADQTLCSNDIDFSLGLAGSNGEAWIYSRGSTDYT